MFIIPNNVILKVAQFYNVYKNTTYKLYYNTHKHIIFNPNNINQFYKK